MYRQLLLHDNMKREQQRLEQISAELESTLQTLPQGTIHERKGRFYHVFRVDGKQHMRAIKDPALLHQLRVRRHIQQTLPKRKRRLENCNLFLERDELYDTRETLLELPERYKPVDFKEFWLPGDLDPEEWGRAEYEHNDRPIEKPSETAGGRIVRSKSEAFIGSELEAVPLLHRYEQKLVLFGEVFYPDFIFILPVSRMLVIWEHFGRMDDPKYAKRTMHKIDTYNKAGWILGINFFFTYETEDMPFSFPGAKAKMAEILAADKFIW